MFHKSTDAASSSPTKDTRDNELDTAKTPETEPDEVEPPKKAGPKSLKAIKVITCDGYSQIIQNGFTTLKCNTKGCSFVGETLRKMRFHIQVHIKIKIKFIVFANCIIINSIPTTLRGSMRVKIAQVDSHSTQN
jgi:hypothetical protein